MELTINGTRRAVAPGWKDESLLAVLREHLGLTGAKFGCGVGLCGACTVLLDGQPQRSCLIAVSTLGNRAITTLEGLASPDGRLHPVQQAWLDEAVPQCGYCQGGQIMATVALLRDVPQPSDTQTDDALARQLCRCGTQHRIRCAIRRAANAS
jgi:isoquinoline 1-oxidoreductase alpha subunit